MSTSLLTNSDLIIPSRVVFGSSRRERIGTLTAELGKTAIIIDGRNDAAQATWPADEVCKLFAAAGVEIVGTERVSREPQVADIDAITSRYRTARSGSLVLVGIGGGSAIDVAKAVAAMLPQTTNSVLDYLEGVGTGATLEAAPLPILAVPTTAGTGAEATRNAVIASSDNMDAKFKKSLRDDRLMPRTVLIDPELSLSCPMMVTACSGLDALTQLVESFVAKRRQKVTSAMAAHGAWLAINALADLAAKPDDISARESMAEAAFLSGICLTNAGLGMAHGVAPALGMHAGISHGAACAAMLAATIRTNAVVCPELYAELARAVFIDAQSRSDASVVARLIDCVERLVAAWSLPNRLRDLGVRREQLPNIAADSFGSSMKANPRDLTVTELNEILAEIW
ncbi:MAG: iron-containing alcohol dehydrogenase [Thermoguttaceae bacterium]